MLSSSTLSEQPENMFSAGNESRLSKKEKMAARQRLILGSIAGGAGEGGGDGESPFLRDSSDSERGDTLATALSIRQELVEEVCIFVYTYINYVCVYINK